VEGYYTGSNNFFGTLCIDYRKRPGGDPGLFSKGRGEMRIAPTLFSITRNMPFFDVIIDEDR